MAESVIATYYFRVKRTQSSHCQQEESLPDLKSTDFFLFQVTVKLGRPSIESNSRHPRDINATTLLRTDIFTPCKRFFGDSQCFKERLIAPLYLTLECLDQLTPRIIVQVQQLFNFHESLGSGSAKPSSLKRQIFPLDLEIAVDVPNVNDVGMVPASNEANQSLKTYKLPKQCCICMENFHDGGDDGYDGEFTPWPCGHRFHYQCIVQWVRTSHMRPLCRWPMPTVKS